MKDISDVSVQLLPLAATGDPTHKTGHQSGHAKSD
jgi:hypothetical protein